MARAGAAATTEIPRQVWAVQGAQGRLLPPSLPPSLVLGEELA